jgi:hypothetical protein
VKSGAAGSPCPAIPRCRGLVSTFFPGARRLRSFLTGKTRHSRLVRWRPDLCRRNSEAPAPLSGSGRKSFISRRSPRSSMTIRSKNFRLKDRRDHSPVEANRQAASPPLPVTGTSFGTFTRSGSSSSHQTQARAVRQMFSQTGATTNRLHPQSGLTFAGESRTVQC